MESEDAVLPLPMCHALPLIGTSEPVKQVEVFREANEELSELGRTGHMFVPFVNRSFESEFHGTVNFTYFCCVLLVTWCHCVLLSCYLGPK